jgi:hypothetical protein
MEFAVTGEWWMTAEEFRRRARRCLILARRTVSPENREALIDVALIWMRLAARLDRNNDSKRPRGRKTKTD